MQARRGLEGEGRSETVNLQQAVSSLPQEHGAGTDWL